MRRSHGVNGEAPAGTPGKRQADRGIPRIPRPGGAGKSCLLAAAAPLIAFPSAPRAEP
jgi:hypothetical protein